MAEKTNETTQSGNVGGPSWFNRNFSHVIWGGLSDFWNMTPWGKKSLISKIKKGGGAAPSEVLSRISDLIDLNDNMVGQLDKLEATWGLIERNLYGKDFEFKEDSFNEHVYSDVFRKIGYFKDYSYTNEEATLFQKGGTVTVTSMPGAKIDERRARQKAEKTKADLEKKKKELEAKETRTKKEEEDLQECKDALEGIESFLANTEAYIARLSILPKIEVNEHKSPFLDGREERIVAIGPGNFKSISSDFQALQPVIDHFASSSGFGANVRTPINQIFDALKKSLTKLSIDIEPAHGKELGKIQQLVQEMESTAEAGDVGSNRPWTQFIRFLHTYKIIKPFKVEKIKNTVTGRDEVNIKKFNDKLLKYEKDFKKDDEVEAGTDENGMPLEVFEFPPHSNDYYVLLDLWWAELAENEWHENTIKKKPGGKEKWAEKVTNGIRKRSKYAVPYNSISEVKLEKEAWVRKVPDPKFVGDVDPLDKICFISNEWDSFRDDFRDGRFHPNSKSSMDYLIAELDGITPYNPIKFRIKTTDIETRIRFKPIYYTEAGGASKDLCGNIDPKGGLGEISTDNIPEDERLVTRRYEMKINAENAKPDKDGKVKEETLKLVRKPRHLNPAFDRSAIGHDFIHWGRMLYYETPDGIEKWSENPFPHVATRGFGKYLINLVLNNTYSLEEARRVLKGHLWDYGVRHYGKPYILDPLGPADSEGGALSHAKAKAAESGGGSARG